MSQLSLYAMPGNAGRAAAIAAALQGRFEVVLGSCRVHRFPDGESLLQLDPPQSAPQAVLVCSLNDPDVKTVQLLMAADTLRELGATCVGLVAPYLAYMRQDIRFAPGQAVSAGLYAGLLSAHFDWLLTVDPHLHRIHDLGQVYTMQSRVLAAAPRLADWIRDHVEQPLIIGPDGESEQWAAAVAQRVGAPLLVMRKVRSGDFDVSSSIPDLQRYPGRTPVLLDDIISSGRTLVAALDHLRQAAAAPAVCVAVHGLFAADALPALRAAGAARIVCTDSTDSALAATGVEIVSLSADLGAAIPELLSAS